MMKLKCNFIRYISHELRSPLNTISMGIQLHSKQKRLCCPQRNDNDVNREHIDGNISDTFSDADLTTTLLDMIIACDHNVSVLNNLATYELLERGVLLSPVEIRVHDFVRDLVNYNQDKAAARDKIMILSEPAVDVQNITVSADSYRLQQVVQNILDVLLNLTPKNKTIVFSIDRVGNKGSAARNRVLTYSSPRLETARSAGQLLAAASSISSQMGKYLGRLVPRTRTAPDQLGYVRITVSILDFLPTKVTLRLE